MACGRHHGPVARVMAGGYAKELTDVVEINLGTIRQLLGNAGGAASGMLMGR